MLAQYLQQSPYLVPLSLQPDHGLPYTLRSRWRLGGQAYGV